MKLQFIGCCTLKSLLINPPALFLVDPQAMLWGEPCCCSLQLGITGSKAFGGMNRRHPSTEIIPEARNRHATVMNYFPLRPGLICETIITYHKVEGCIVKSYALSHLTQNPKTLKQSKKDNGIKKKTTQLHIVYRTVSHHDDITSKIIQEYHISYHHICHTKYIQIPYNERECNELYDNNLTIPNTF